MDNYLYHITNFKALEGILTQDTLKVGKTHHWKDLQSEGHFRNAVSLTRDLTFSSRYMPSSASVILVLDRDKLMSKYKITPVADTANELNPQAGRRVGQSKAEECIYSNIVNLHNYLVKILIKNSTQIPESTSDILKEYNSKYSVPFTLTECLTEADHTQKAIDAFGTTYYRTRAGFMLKDGRLLDLTYGGGPREDHRNIQDAFDDMDLDGESDYLIEFMNEGNIRLIPEMPGIDIVVKPTDKQYAALKGYIDFFIGRNKYFGVQFSNKNGDQVGWKEYSGFTSPAEIILDIKEYFDGTSLNESYDYTVSDIIGTDTLYHATYKPYWEEIKKSGVLRPKAHSNWDISGDFIYLSRDPDNAFSHAETSELVPEEYLDQIVVLEIDANKLNLDLLDCDHNQAYEAEDYEVDYEDPQTWEEMQYAGSIPLRAIKKVYGESELKEEMEKSKHHQMIYYDTKAALQGYNDDAIQKVVDSFIKDNQRRPQTLKEVYPQKNETKSDFINRFMRVTAREYPNVKQRYAVANSYWDSHDKKKLNESTSSSEIIDAVKEHFVIDDYPVSGPSFLLPDGSFIDLTSSFNSSTSYEDFPAHREVEDYLEDIGLSSLSGDASGSPTIQQLGAIRLNDLDENNFVELSSIKPTYEQYNQLEDWFAENSEEHSTVEVSTYRYGDYIRYDYEEVFPEDIIKRIKRYYSSGHLYEAIESNSVFNLKKIGMSHYDEWLNSQPARDRDNVKIEVKELSPKEYLEACAKIFGNSFESQKKQIQYDREIIKELQDLIEKGVSLNATFLDYVSDPPTQEGRHRMYALAELYGWDKKYPVIIFTPADPEKAKRDQLEKQQEKLYKYIDKAVTNALDYTYRNYDELKDQISYYLENYIDDPEVKISERGHWLTITVNDLEYEISQDEFDWDEDKSDPDDDFDIEDLS